MTNLVYMSPREYLLAVAIGTEKNGLIYFNSKYNFQIGFNTF